MTTDTPISLDSRRKLIAVYQATGGKTHAVREGGDINRPICGKRIKGWVDGRFVPPMTWDQYLVWEHPSISQAVRDMIKRTEELNPGSPTHADTVCPQCKAAAS